MKLAHQLRISGNALKFKAPLEPPLGGGAEARWAEYRRRIQRENSILSFFEG